MGGSAAHAGNQRSRENEHRFHSNLSIWRTTLPFKIEANPDFPTETEPVCILNDIGVRRLSGTGYLITVGPGASKRSDTWELTFRWATAGAALPASGSWTRCFRVSAPGPNLVVPGFPQVLGPGGSAARVRSESIVVAPVRPGAPPAGDYLFRLYATLRWGPWAPLLELLVARKAH